MITRQVLRSLLQKLQFADNIFSSFICLFLLVSSKKELKIAKFTLKFNHNYGQTLDASNDEAIGQTTIFNSSTSPFENPFNYKIKTTHKEYEVHNKVH